MTTQKNKEKGFTIIEVVLVLAIAGLIFLIVFLALPALQRNQRDTARRNDVGRAIAAVQSYQSNSQGALPGTATTVPPASFVDSYLKAGGSSFTDPSGSDYTWSLNDDAPTRPALGWHPGNVCSAGGAPTTTGAGARQVAITISLEGGGVYCTSN